MSQIGRNWDSEKVLQTKSVVQKMVNQFQLKVYSERITQQKQNERVLNGKYLGGLISQKNMDWSYSRILKN